MIEVGVRREATRRSKIAFWAVGSTVALSTTVVASAITSMVAAVVIGLGVGVLCGAVAGAAVFCWPVLRVMWHWALEIVALLALLAGYLFLASIMPWWASIAVLLSCAATPLIVGPFRRRFVAWAWCAVSRHRLRLCFTAFIASQRWGSSPLILLARPIPAGERVWIWLRPGLSASDLESRMDRLAAGCWAAECRISPASRRFSALVHIDVVRRNPLVGLVTSPLSDLLPADVAADVPASPAVAPVGLDLPDTPEQGATVPADGKGRHAGAGPVGAQSAPATVPDVVPAPRGGAEDLSDWI